jgi:hypothetical protein
MFDCIKASMVLVSLTAIIEPLELQFQVIDSISSDGTYAYICGLDSNHDGQNELLFTSKSLRVMTVYEWQPEGRLELEHVMPWGHLWAVGDFDGDGKSDVWADSFGTIAGEGYVYTYDVESWYDWAYPGRVVWVDSFPQWHMLTHQQAAYLDPDDHIDFLGYLDYVYFIYECEGDDSYELIFFDTLDTGQLGDAAIGDFDQDGLTEFVFVGLRVIEAVGDDTFAVVAEPEGLPGMLYDFVSANDMDRDGKPEFVAHTYRYNWITGMYDDRIWVYEATGDNEYEQVWYTMIPDNPVFPRYGSTGTWMGMEPRSWSSPQRDIYMYSRLSPMTIINWFGREI